MRLCCALIIILGVLTACGDTTPRPEEIITDPQATLEQAVENIRLQSTFRLLIEQLGAEYAFSVSLNAGISQLSATMRYGTAQYVAPDNMYARVKLTIGGLPPQLIGLYAQGMTQWFSLAGGSWINFPIAAGFDPGELVKEDGGFNKALGQLRDIQFMGIEYLIDGSRTQHIRGFANGDVINDLMFNLLDVQNDNVIVDVYLDPIRNLPLKISVTIPNTKTEAEPKDTQWSIELYDFNEPAEYVLNADGFPTKADAR
jgi:hypothetical protein